MKSNHILYTVISIVCVFLTQYETRAQGSTGQKPEVIRLPDPQPPNAAELGKYGVYPAAEYTGVLPVSIPLFEISVGGKSLPFSLNYHASGIKVSQRETEVGLGWSLSGIYTISRTVMGGPDEKLLSGSSGVYFHTPKTGQEIINYAFTPIPTANQGEILTINNQRRIME